MNALEIAAFLVRSIVAGLVGTAGMTGVMHVIDRWGVANAKMVVAVGSILTKSRTNAMPVGLILHFTAGAVFAILYALAFLALRVQGVGASMGIGVVAGFVHGFAMSFVLVIAVAEHHPLPEFRETGFAIAVVHVVGHVVYGALVGLVLGIAGALH